MRLIDADALYRSVMKKVCDDCPYDDDMECDGDDCKAGMMLRMIDDAPTVDAVPVVRCKDCKHFEELHDGIGTCEFERLGNAYHTVDGIINEDWHCADGERRSECD